VAAHLDEIEKVGARFVSVMDGLDTESKSARAAVVLLADFARAESENTSMRVEGAERHLRKSDRWLGGRPPYGLKPDPGTRRLTLDPETLEPVHIGEGIISVEERELILRRIGSRTLRFTGGRAMQGAAPRCLQDSPIAAVADRG
jgi:hypothetical protein